MSVLTQAQYIYTVKSIKHSDEIFKISVIELYITARCMSFKCIRN